MNTQIEELLQRKMDRKEFLKSIAAFATAAVGLGMIASVFQSQQNQKNSRVASNGYGSSVYGGHAPTSTPTTQTRQ